MPGDPFREKRRLQASNRLALYVMLGQQVDNTLLVVHLTALRLKVGLSESELLRNRGIAPMA